MKLKEYLKELHSLYSSGSATEGSYYRVLARLIEENFKGFKVIILPKRTAGGFPDLKVITSNGHIVGYIECKRPGVSLPEVERSEQVKRYKGQFKNFLLTNFLDFKLYGGGILLEELKLLNFKDFERGKLKPLAKEKELFEFLKEFLSYSEKPITTLSELAERLSWRVRILKEELLREVKENSVIKALYNSIKEFIIESLSEEEFADTIAQSLAYGLLILKLRKGEVRKEEIIYDFPRSLAVIREIFIEVLKVRGGELEWALEEIEQVLNLFDERKVKLSPDELTTHFYEPFLKAYNPELREVRGVYYTPKEVVSFINASVEEVLRESFGKEGFKDRELTFLDPAAGTLTFVLDAFEKLKEELSEEGSGVLRKFFDEIVLSNYYAFELLPAPYVIGHLRISQFLKELGIEDKRFQLYLTNTLEFHHEHPGYLFSNAWAEETKRADEVKREKEIMVIVGNPPYSGISANNLKSIREFLRKDIAVKREDGEEVCQSYYRVNGKDLQTFIRETSGSKKVKVWLQDDYVKFIRFAQWKVCSGGKGIVGYITNHSYLDNPTFAGMRESLLRSFDKIYILNLHGNKRKKEPDENVFDIMQGVAVGIFVKDGSKRGEFAELFYYSTLEDEGLLKREEKLDFLRENSLSTLKWRRVKPKPPYYFFVPAESRKGWESFIPVSRIFKEFVSGIVTARDGLVVGFTPEEVEEKIRLFLDPQVPDKEIRELFKVNDNYAWKLSEARETLRRELKGKDLKSFIKPILYRPFDKRFIFYHPTVVFRDRYDVMKHMISTENLALILGKQWHVIGSQTYDITFISDNINDYNIFRRGGGVLFPLYLYSDDGSRAPNYTSEVSKVLKELYGEETSLVSPEELFYYTYALLYSPDYREKFKELLKYEFPRIPFPEKVEELKELAEKGKRLAELHLLKGVSLKGVKFVGDNFKVERVNFKNGRLYINENSYFEPVSGEVFSYRIGGYQVLRKWLKDRKGRELSLDEIETLRKIVRSLEETVKLQKELRLEFL
ncbi:type ISP restriction/modification enzyme [Thermovibrio sp.]